MIKILDKLFDNFLYWLERVQWERDARRIRRTKKKNEKHLTRIREKIKAAENLLRDNGYTFERDWQDIEYKGEKYTPIMIEEFEHFDHNTIVLTARKNNF